MNPAAIRLLRRIADAVPHPFGRLAFAVFLAFMASASSVALMGVAAWLLSRAAEHPPVMYLTVAAVLVRAFGISRGAFRYVERLVGHDLALHLQSALRLETYGRLAQTTLLGRRRGDLLTRVVADVEAIMDLVVRVVLPFLSGGLVILATTVILGAFSPASAAVLLGSAAVAGGVMPWLANRLSRRADADAVGERAELAASVHEMARTASDLVAYGAAETHLDRLLAVDARLRRIEDRSAWVRGLASGAQVVASGVAVIGALMIGGDAVLRGELPATMLAVLALTPLALHDVLTTLAQAAQTWTRAGVALDRVAALVDAPAVGSGDRDVSAPPAERPEVRLTDLTIGWPGGPALASGLSLVVGPGERVAVVGASGVGKTTLAATILGLIPPQAGTVSVAGRVGYLAQDAHLFATSVAENVKIGNRDASDADVVDALARAGLALPPERVVGELGATLSGGEGRRLALSRLFVGEQQVFVLDEPSEHLDAETAAAVLDDIWATTVDAPVLVITHDADVVARCDRVVRLG